MQFTTMQDGDGRQYPVFAPLGHAWPDMSLDDILINTLPNMAIVSHTCDNGETVGTFDDAVVAVHPMDIGFPAPSGTLSRPEYIAMMEDPSTIPAPLSVDSSALAVRLTHEAYAPEPDARVNDAMSAWERELIGHIISCAGRGIPSGVVTHKRVDSARDIAKYMCWNGADAPVFP